MRLTDAQHDALIREAVRLRKPLAEVIRQRLCISKNTTREHLPDNTDQ